MISGVVATVLRETQSGFSCPESALSAKLCKERCGFLQLFFPLQKTSPGARALARTLRLRRAWRRGCGMAVRYTGTYGTVSYQ